MVDRLGVAHGLGLDRLGRHAQGDQFRLHRLGADQRHVEIGDLMLVGSGVLGPAGGMADHPEVAAALLLQGRHVAQHAAVAGVQVGRTVAEEDDRGQLTTAAGGGPKSARLAVVVLPSPLMITPPWEKNSGEAWVSSGAGWV